MNFSWLSPWMWNPQTGRVTGSTIQGIQHTENPVVSVSTCGCYPGFHTHHLPIFGKSSTIRLKPQRPLESPSTPTPHILSPASLSTSLVHLFPCPSQSTTVPEPQHGLPASSLASPTPANPTPRSFLHTTTRASPLKMQAMKEPPKKCKSL